MSGEVMRIAVLIGGSGRSLKNLMDLRNEKGLIFDKVRIQCVVGHNKDVAGFKYVRDDEHPLQLGLPCSWGSSNIFPYLESHSVDLAVMAGWIKLLKIPDKWVNRVMNIHPSLLPSFGGKGMYGHHVHAAVIESGVKFSGCTVHFADNEYDHGPIILQRLVPVLNDDTPEALAARVFEQEKIAYPEAIKLFADGRLVVKGRHVQCI